MNVTRVKTLEDIFKNICEGNKVLCVEIDYPDAFDVGSMKLSEINDYLNTNIYIFIAVED